MKKKDKIAILGYGSQGKAMALNLRDSGYSPTVGLRAGSKSIKLAQKENLRTASIPDAVADADYIIAAIPDHVHKNALNNKFFAPLTKKPSLVFLHGSSIHFGQVVPPGNLPVLMLAPHAPGLAVREKYLNNSPYSAFVAVEQGAKRKGFESLASLAKAIGIDKSRLIKTTFADEAVGDLFGEQAVLCGGLARLLKFGFESLVEKGIPPKNAYLEVAYQIDLIVELVKQHGLEGMFERISPMARYGSIINGPKVLDNTVKENMKNILDDIHSGRFLKNTERGNLKVSKKQLANVTNKLFDKQARKFNK